jgi:hypothetical protein
MLTNARLIQNLTHTHLGHRSPVEKCCNYASKQHEVPDSYIKSIYLHCTITICRTCQKVSAKTTGDLANLLAHEFRNDSVKCIYT